MLAATLNNEDDEEFCPNCGTYTSSLNSYTGWCDECSGKDPYSQLEAYLAKNADHIEYYIFQGFSLFGAIACIRGDYRPSCACCGGVIYRAPKNAIFCSKNEKCRTAKNRYSYLWKRKGLSKSEALAKTIRELAE